MSILYVDGKRMRRVILASLKWLVAKQELLNKLNVYPVPDGDTGTNMVLTLRSAVDCLEKKNCNLPEVTKRLSDGALLGARGNSGVILSQIIRGFADGLAGKSRVNVSELAESLDRAVERAYTAIANPVEGTILTVLRESIAAASEVARTDPDMIHYLEKLHDEAIRSLERTPEQLPVLKEAGVVDSGAMGFVCIVEGIMRLVRGEKLDVELTAEELVAGTPVISEPYTGSRFCTEFILKCGAESQQSMREFLQDKGESLVLVNDDEVLRVHIHTDEPAEILAHARSLGEVSREKVDDMQSQHEHLFTPMESSEEPAAALGLFCTAPGEGFVKIFRSLGASQVLLAGDTSNPSVQEILETADGVNAEHLIFLPNNKNIILAAEQAASASKRPMTVVKTRSVIQGIAAAISFDASGSPEELVEEMAEAMTSVKTLAVTKSVRDSSLDGMQITSGEYFSILDGRAVKTGVDLDSVALESVKAAHADEDTMAVYYGEGVTETQAQQLVGRIEEAVPGLDTEIHEGGQPHYPYFISLE